MVNNLYCYDPYLMSIVLNVGAIGHPGGQQKNLPFSHGRDLTAFNGTGLQNRTSLFRIGPR